MRCAGGSRSVRQCQDNTEALAVHQHIVALSGLITPRHGSEIRDRGDPHTTVTYDPACLGSLDIQV